MLARPDSHFVEACERMAGRRLSTLGKDHEMVGLSPSGFRKLIESNILCNILKQQNNIALDTRDHRMPRKRKGILPESKTAEVPILWSRTSPIGA